MQKLVDLRILNYWCKIINSSDEKLTSIIYKFQRKLFESGEYQSEWMLKIKSILDNCGLSYIWLCNSVDQKMLNYLVNRTLSASFEQDWHSEVQTNGLCKSYRIFKETFQTEKYILNLDNPFCKWLIKYRCGGANIPVISGRYDGVPFDERNCTLCNANSLGDEYHYVLECPFLRNLRVSLIPAYYRNRSSAFRFAELMNSNNRKIQFNLGKFCKAVILHFRL